jgi:radical SAM protein (TIGR01212 family)
MKERRFNSFGSFVERHFGGKKLHKVNIDAGFTCPNRDGTVGYGGCIYCNNASFRPASCRPSFSIAEQVENGINYLKGRYGAELFLAYFQPYTNTYAPTHVLEAYYREALANPSVVGLAIGTRPDCVDEEKIGLLQLLSSHHFILVEYGLQSIYEKSLNFINRGHDYQTFLDALALTRGRGIHIGAHLIAGFPTETRNETLAMAEAVSELEIGFLKLHQLQVVKETKLARMYEEKPFNVFGYEEYIEFAADFLERLNPEIVLQRLFATAPDEILIAPQWGAGRHRILQDIESELARRESFQGKLYKARASLGN